MLENGECPLCGGRGWIVEADGGNGVARACDCRLKSRGRQRLASAGIPARYERCSLDRFHTPHDVKAAREQLEAALLASRQYVETFLQPGGFKASGLIFIGPTGCGKTHLAVAVLQELISLYKVRGRFVEFTELLQRLRDSFDRDAREPRHAILRPIIEAELLVLDELGSQQASAWVRDVLYLIINTRYTRRRPTIVTTNFHLDEVAQGPGTDRQVGQRERGHRLEPLAHRLPAPLVSRLCEMGQQVRMDAVSDYRREIGGAALQR